MVLDLLELPGPGYDHAHLARFEEAVHLQRIGRLVGVERLVLECHVTQQLQRLDPLRAAEKSLLVGAVEHVAALLPDHRPEPPGRVLAARDRIAGADDVLARVRELLGHRAVVAPRPVRLGRRDAGRLEHLLVVDDREVVDHGGEADDLRADRRRAATRRIEAVPVEARRLDVLRDVDDLARLRHVRHVRAVHVGDVGVVVGADHGLQLLHHLVAVRAELVVHDDAGMRLVELRRRACGTSSAPSRSARARRVMSTGLYAAGRAPATAAVASSAPVMTTAMSGIFFNGALLGTQGRERAERVCDSTFARHPRYVRNQMPKIAFVGAGSVEFTRNLLGDILAFPGAGRVRDLAARHRPRAPRNRRVARATESPRRSARSRRSSASLEPP